MQHVDWWESIDAASACLSGIVALSVGKCTGRFTSGFAQHVAVEGSEFQYITGCVVEGSEFQYITGCV